MSGDVFVEGRDAAPHPAVPWRPPAPQQGTTWPETAVPRLRKPGVDYGRGGTAAKIAMKLVHSQQSVPSGRGGGTKCFKEEGGVICVTWCQEHSTMKAGGTAGLGVMEDSHLGGSSLEDGSESQNAVGSRERTKERHFEGEPR